MPVKIPLVPQIANYRMSTVLDGANYILDIRWNGRGEVWKMDVYTEDEIILARSLSLVLGAIVGARVIEEGFPPGQFIVSDLTDAGKDATFDDMGTRVQLYYFSEDE